MPRFPFIIALSIAISSTSDSSLVAQEYQPMATFQSIQSGGSFSGQVVGPTYSSSQTSNLPSVYQPPQGVVVHGSGAYQTASGEVVFDQASSQPGQIVSSTYHAPNGGQLGTSYIVDGSGQTSGTVHYQTVDGTTLGADINSVQSGGISYGSANGDQLQAQYAVQNFNQMNVQGGATTADGSQFNGTFSRENGQHSGNVTVANRDGSSFHGTYNYQGTNNFSVGAQQRSADGSEYGGTITRQNGQHSGNVTVQNRDGSSFQGAYTYQGTNSFSAGAQQRSADGSQFGGAITRQNGQHTGNVNVQNRNGSGYQGAYNYQGTNDFSVSGQQRSADGNGYGGSIARDGGRAIVSAEYRQNGHIPGTQERYRGTVDINGADSKFTAEGELWDATGNTRLGSSVTSVDGRGANIVQTSGTQNMGSTVQHSTQFQGTNSTFQYSQNARVPGMVVQQSATMNRRQVGGAAHVKIGGQRVGVDAKVSQGGLFVRGTGPNISTGQIRPPTVAQPRLFSQFKSVAPPAPKAPAFKWHYKPVTPPTFNYTPPPTYKPSFDVSKLKFQPYKPPASASRQVNRISSNARSAASRAGSRISNTTKSAGGSIARQAKSAGGSISRQTKSAGGSISRGAKALGGRVSSAFGN